MSKFLYFANKMSYNQSHRIRSFRVQVCSITFISSVFILITKHTLRMVFQQDVVDIFQSKEASENTHCFAPNIILLIEKNFIFTLRRHCVENLFHTYLYIILTIFLLLNFVIDKCMTPHVVFSNTVTYTDREDHLYT